MGKSKTPGSVTLEEISDNANGARAQYSMDGGITSGTTFSPAANCTRAQIVTFLYLSFVK